MARLKRRNSKKIALLGMGLGLLGVVCLSTIGFASFNFRKADESTVDGNFTVISDLEYIQFKTRDISTDMNVEFEGFRNGIIENSTELALTRTAKITAYIDVEYIYQNTLDDSRDLEFAIGIEQKNNVVPSFKEGDEVYGDSFYQGYKELHMLSSLDNVEIKNINTSKKQTFSKANLIGNPNSNKLTALTSCDTLNILSKDLEKHTNTLEVMFTFVVDESVNFMDEIFVKMVEQDISFGIGVIYSETTEN